MTIHHFPDYKEMSIHAAQLCIDRIQNKQALRIGVPTGSSPKMTYKIIGQYLEQHDPLRSRIEIVQLDEWYGLSSDHSSSCNHAIMKEVIRPWKLSLNQCFLIKGDVQQKEQLIVMKKLLEERPLDLCILGFGKNGHLALNEPGALANESSRIVNLHNDSRLHEMLPDNNSITKGITIGMKEIMESKEILLLITGRGKNKSYQSFLQKKLSIPASHLYQHNNCTCLVDDSSVN